MSTLAIWILEDYGDKWALKHTASILEVFEKTTDIDFFYCSGVNEYYSTVYPQWNLILFVGVGKEADIIAYNMGSRKLHVIPTRYSHFLKCGILPQINGRPYYLPYVPLFPKLASLAEE
jgi:hypothetical protein